LGCAHARAHIRRGGGGGGGGGGAQTCCDCAQHDKRSRLNARAQRRQRRRVASGHGAEFARIALRIRRGERGEEKRPGWRGAAETLRDGGRGVRNVRPKQRRRVRRHLQRGRRARHGRCGPLRAGVGRSGPLRAALDKESKTGPFAQNRGGFAGNAERISFSARRCAVCC
jgi:hypothetical protein